MYEGNIKLQFAAEKVAKEHNSTHVEYGRNSIFSVNNQNQTRIILIEA